MNGPAERRDPAAIVWEGDSKEVLQSFPDGVRQNLGFQLWQLHGVKGRLITDRWASVGPGVFELCDQDERAWYRVIYLSRIKGVIHVLHCFEKKSREMPRRDFEVARQRLRGVKARLAEEKRK